jgi:hypothetical protein
MFKPGGLLHRVSAFTFKTPINSRIEEILTAKAKKAHRV